jgi:hypothetical protein
MSALRTVESKHHCGEIVILVFLVIAAIGVFLTGVLVRAQTSKTAGAPALGSSAAVLVRGTVERVLRHACDVSSERLGTVTVHPGSCALTDLILETKNGSFDVQLGPSRYLRENLFFFVPGDRVIVRGQVRKDHGLASLLADLVIKGKQALPLRDQNGVPFWR